MYGPIESVSDDATSSPHADECTVGARYSLRASRMAAK